MVEIHAEMKAGCWMGGDAVMLGLGLLSELFGELL